MMRRHVSAVSLVVVLVGSVAACGAAANKPCGWYFARDRANVTQGPVRWLAGVWRGGDHGDWIWTPLERGTMAGVWRRVDPTPEVRFFTIRHDGAQLTLASVTEAGVVTTFDAVEQGERFVVFANAEREHVSFRGTHGGLDLSIELDGVVARHRLRLEI
jgi:hypothetical protein